MAKKQVSLEVSADTYDFVVASVGLGLKVKARLDDGFQLDQDLAALLPDLVAFGADVSKAGKIDDEFADDPAATVLAGLVALAPALAEFAKKDENGNPA